MRVVPEPVTVSQKVLHLADYLASRKDINMTLEEDYEKPDSPVEAVEPTKEVVDEGV